MTRRDGRRSRRRGRPPTGFVLAVPRPAVGRVRSTAAARVSHGSSGATGASEPSANRTPEDQQRAVRERAAGAAGPVAARPASASSWTWAGWTLAVTPEFGERGRESGSRRRVARARRTRVHRWPRSASRTCVAGLVADRVDRALEPVTGGPRHQSDCNRRGGTVQHAVPAARIRSWQYAVRCRAIRPRSPSAARPSPARRCPGPGPRCQRRRRSPVEPLAARSPHRTRSRSSPAPIRRAHVARVVGDLEVRRRRPPRARRPPGRRRRPGDRAPPGRRAARRS